MRFFGGFYVAADADGQEYTLRCPKKFRHQRLSPLVGDAVRFTPGQGEEEGWLVEILPRKTESIRPPVANVTLLLVSICPSPEPDLLLVDRLLARAKKQGMKTALIVGKCDLDGGALLSQMQEEYRGADCPVLGVSARNKEGLDSVRALMRGADCCCLAGQSGVGKSTLFKCIVGEEKPDCGTIRFGAGVDIGYYDQHQDQFTQPQRTRYSIIQTKTEDEAKAVLDELNKGGDFAALATIPDELKNAGLKEKGQLSGVIKSSVGFLIVRLDDIQPAKVKSLDEVRDDIAAKVKHEKALDAYYALQQKVSDAASNDTESLAGAEQAAGVKATQTGWFSKDNLPEELNFKPVADAIFNGGLVGENGAPGINSDIITVDGDRAFVLRISEHKPEAVKPLADVQEQVKALVQHNKAEKLLVDLKAGKGAEAMQAAGLKFGEPKTLSRSGRDPISQAAFALPLPAKDKPSYGMATDMQGNVVLLALDEVKQGSMPEDQKKAMVQGITQNNRL